MYLLNQVIARFTLSIGVVIVSVMQFSNMNTEEKIVRAEEKAKRSKKPRFYLTVAFFNASSIAFMMT